MQPQVGNAPAVQAAQARRDEAVARARREGLDVGRKEGEAAALALYQERLAAVREEAATAASAVADARGLYETEIRGAAYWRGKLVGGLTGLVVGVMLTGLAAGMVWGQNERALRAGAETAQGGVTAGAAIEAMRQGMESSK